MPLAIAFWILALVWSLWSIWTWPPVKRAWAGFRNRPYAESTATEKTGAEPTAEPSFPNPQSILSGDEEHDALSHLRIGDPYYSRVMTIDKAADGWPLQFPLSVDNRRNPAISVIGYDITFQRPKPTGGYLDALTVSWDGKSSATRQGSPIRDFIYGTCIIIPGNDRKVLHIPLEFSQLPKKPTESPYWTIKGRLEVECGGARRTVDFEASSKSFSLPQNEWDQVRAHIMTP